MFIIVFLILGGAGLLLYGIEVMKDSLEWVSEGKAQRMIEASGSSVFKSILAGIVVTGINQKSSATTIMVVGLVNTGMISLTKAAAVIMGANIGTTITAQLLAFRLEYLAPCIVGVGAVFWKYAKTKRVQYTAEIFIGFGIMFIGMLFMEQGMVYLRESTLIQESLTLLSRPYSFQYLLLILVGFVATSILRSSSLLTGIMIAMSAQGLLTVEMGVPLILGINVGKCMTAIIDSRSAGRTAKRAAVIHLLFNTTGMILAAVFFQELFSDLMQLLAPGDLPRQIANAHTIFNLGTTILCAPLVSLLVALSDKLVPGKKHSEQPIENLDVRMLETPGLALAQTYNEIITLAKMSFESYAISFQCVQEPDEKDLDRIQEQEEKILRLEKDIEVYLVKLAQRNITKQQHEMLNLMLGVISDIERISDLAASIAEMALYKKENSIEFSRQAEREMEEFHEQISRLIEDLMNALEKRDVNLANNILPAEIKIKGMETILRDNHIDRLSKGICNPGSGVLFIDLINSMEHVAQHVRKIGHFVIEASRY
ncbi:MAG: Na/Pi cotransporter family protein [Anaerovoracaceae bacterium]|jgi:phosphate:Na+ symporter